GAWSFYSLNDEEVSDCERGTTLIFSSDNKFSLKTYSLDNGNDKKEKVCKLVAHISGTWHKNDIKYVFNYENGNTEETNILFSENGNKITTFHVVIEKENLEKGNTIGHRKILKKVWIRK
ncbi:MAG: lipocalin family protein, partial [Tenacibaculum sp.]|nr:lipocalin family protein [Tenacibaculum sp.]